MTPRKIKKSIISPAFKLRHTLRGHEDVILRVNWSPDGTLLASTSVDKTIRIWDFSSGNPLHILKGHYQGVNYAAWSPDMATFVSASFDRTIRVWSLKTDEPIKTLSVHEDDVPCIAWSPDGKLLASCSIDKSVFLWNPDTWETITRLQEHSGGVHYLAWSQDGQKLASCSYDRTIKIWDRRDLSHSIKTLKGHGNQIIHIAWSNDGQFLASSSFDRTIRIWDPAEGREMAILEGHTGTVRSVSFSRDNRLLASNSNDGTVKIWRAGTWDILGELEEPAAFYWPPSIAFSRGGNFLATLGEHDSVIRIWELDVDELLSTAPAEKYDQYVNAKVVLVGDTGVGKTGLGLVLTGQPFIATPSTHGRRVWDFHRQEINLGAGRKETREILLWDLAGQAAYRLVHQLSLHEVAAALVVFDARSETDPFAGVRHWARALQTAYLTGSSSRPAIRKFLVAARIDRSGIAVSKERIQRLVADLGFDNYFETSAADGRGIDEVAAAVRNAIDWDVLAKISSTALFQKIKMFLIAEKEAKRDLSTTDDLFRSFLEKERVSETPELRSQFDTSVRQVDSRGLIRRLSFGNLVLLRPELLDAYASAIIFAALEEPGEMGSILEEVILAGDFPLSDDERIKGKKQEELLLIAVLEEFFQHDIALREHSEHGRYLVFPSQVTRENPELPDPSGKSVIFSFEGPAVNVYVTLAVRLSHSGLFSKKEMWRNASAYSAIVGGTCGIYLREVDGGHGELTIFFDEQATETTRFQFEEYIRSHLQRHALPDSIHRRRVFECADCKTPVTDMQVLRRRERGFGWIECNVCGQQVSLRDGKDRLEVLLTSVVPDMDREADGSRAALTADAIVRGKRETKDFDVFLCHNTKDKPSVKEVGRMLIGRGLLPWLDEWELQPGLPWQDLLEQQISRIRSAAVFVGKDSIGPWQKAELNAFLGEFVRRGCPVIPVLLPDAIDEPQLPVLLKAMTWVDFRLAEPAPLERLIWGITGKRELGGS